MTAEPEDQPTRALDSERPAPSATALPESIGPFRILGLLGEGGMGRVYRAMERTPAREVALKVAGLPTRAALERFQREIELLAQLEHPGIARLYATGVDAHSGLPWLSMELVAGEDLGRWAMRTQPGREAIVEVLLSICTAVQYAHGRGVLHRDLKPSNVFVTAEGDARVLDFGIARLLGPSGSGDPTLTVAGQILGTLPYMGPEQLAGDTVDARSDVYALGVIAYELLGGQLPYPRLRTASAFEALDIIRAGDPPPLGSLSRRAQGDLGDVVMKAIAPERERRYASVDAFAADLRAVLESRPVSARPPTPSYLIGRFMRRHRALSTAIGSVALVLVFATGISLRFALAEAGARAEAEERAAEAQAINDFLTDMLQSADPERSLGRQLRVSDLLAPAESSLLGSDSLAPSARARLLSVLAGVHLNLGQPESALATVGRGEAIDLEPGDSLRDIQLSQRSRALLDLGRSAEALTLLDAALAQGERSEEGRIGLEFLRVQAQLELGGDPAGHEAKLRALLTDARASLGDQHPNSVLALHNLSVVLQTSGKWQEALAISEQVVALRSALHGSEHPQTLYSRNIMSNLLFRMGRVEESLALSREVLEARRRALGDAHPSVWVSTQAIGALLMTQGEVESGAELLQQALERFDERFGPSSNFALLTRDALGQAHEKLGNLEQAQSLYEQVIANGMGTDGLLRSEAMPTRNNLAMLLSDAGRKQEALLHFDRLLPEAEARYGSAHPYVGMFRGNRAQCLAELGRRAEARLEFQHSLENLRASLGEAHPRTQRVQSQLDALGTGA
ncbi:MAG: serine/threonine-protein kinase [Aquimonas sp.]|nr:serine/threonine-protein kinase [Aquimonas sp.]